MCFVRSEARTQTEDEVLGKLFEGIRTSSEIGKSGSGNSSSLAEVAVSKIRSVISSDHWIQNTPE